MTITLLLYAYNLKLGLNILIFFYYSKQLNDDIYTDIGLL